MGTSGRKSTPLILHDHVLHHLLAVRVHGIQDSRSILGGCPTKKIVQETESEQLSRTISDDSMQREQDSETNAMDTQKAETAAVIDFLTQAAAAVSALTPDDDDSTTITEIRQRILDTQRAVLDTFPAALEPSTIESYSQHPAAQELNTAARATLARLVLHLPRPTAFADDTEDDRDTVWLEFCGLCQAVVTLEGTMEFLMHGNNNNDVATTPSSFAPHFPVQKFPFQRMQSLQEHCMAVLGVDPAVGRRQLALRVGTSDTDNDPVRLAFAELSLTVQTILEQTSQQVLMSEGGTTRVIRVEHSLVGEGDETVATTARTESMVRDSYDGGDDKITTAPYPATSQLEQALLGELLTMRDEVREERLLEASETAHRVLTKVQAMTSMEERVQYLTSLDADTQKSMAMKKVWDTRVLAASKDGQPPTIQPSSKW